MSSGTDLSNVLYRKINKTNNCEFLNFGVKNIRLQKLSLILANTQDYEITFELVTVIVVSFMSIITSSPKLLSLQIVTKFTISRSLHWVKFQSYAKLQCFHDQGCLCISRNQQLLKGNRGSYSQLQTYTVV